jgi:membrane-associated protein
MVNETIVHLFDQYGYLIFYFAFSLGPFGIPVPNEVTMLTGGMLADNGNLNPWILYAVILFGLLTAVNIGYLAGKVFGQRIHVCLQKSKASHQLKVVEFLFKKYGDIAMCVGILFPVVRYVVPVFAGLNGVTYKKFALFSYSSSIIWTALFFILGKIFREQLTNALSIMDGKLIVIVVVIPVLMVVMGKRQKRKELSIIKGRKIPNSY